MIGIIRFVGLLNAAVWLGAAVSFTLALGPAFFSPEMKQILPPPYNGAAAQIVIQKYFSLLYWCGAVGVIHLLLEKAYTGRKMERATIAVLTVAISLSLCGGFWLQPKLKTLHLAKYDKRSAVESRAQADRSFKVWHGVSQGLNLIVLSSLFVYLHRVSSSSGPSRFTPSQKFRG